MTSLNRSVLGMLAGAVNGDRAALGQLLDAMKEAGNEQAAGKLEAMLRLADDLAGCLWPEGNPDHEWGPDTLDDVAQVLRNAGLCAGVGPDDTACADCGHTHDEHDEYGRCEVCNCAGWLEG